MGKCGCLALFCAILACLSVSFASAPAAHAQGDYGGYSNQEFFLIIVTEVFNSDGNTVAVDGGTTIPSNSQVQEQYGPENPGGGYVTSGVLTDSSGNLINEPPIFIQSGDFPGQVREKGPLAPIIYEQRCGGDTKFSGDLKLGVADTAPVFQAGQPHGALGQLTLHLDTPDVGLYCSYRHAFYNRLDSLNKWTAGATIPVGRNTALFADWERDHRGDDWGWGGIKLSF